MRKSCRGASIGRRKTLKTFVWISSKRSGSVNLRVCQRTASEYFLIKVSFKDTYYRQRDRERGEREKIERYKESDRRGQRKTTRETQRLFAVFVQFKVLG